MVKTYEYDVLIDEEPDLDDGWEVTRIETETLQAGWHKEKVVKLYHVRRDITPVTISLTVKAIVPSWRKSAKDLGVVDFYDDVELELKKQGLSTEDNC